MADDEGIVAQTGETGEGAAEGESVQQGAAETGAAAGTVPQIDWDHDANPHKTRAAELEQRYTGLQGTFKQVHEQNQALTGQMAGMVEQMAVMQAQIDGRSPEEIAQIRQAIRGQAAEMQQQSALQAAHEALNAQRAQADMAAKPLVLKALADKYGVDVADIAEAGSAAEAERLARVAQKHKRTASLQQRSAEGVDRAEGGGSGVVSYDKMSPTEKISHGLAQERRRG